MELVVGATMRRYSEVETSLSFSQETVATRNMWIPDRYHPHGKLLVLTDDVRTGLAGDWQEL